MEYRVRVTRHYEYRVFVIYILQHGLIDVCSHCQVVVQIQKKESILGRGLQFTDTKYRVFQKELYNFESL